MTARPARDVQPRLRRTPRSRRRSTSSPSAADAPGPSRGYHELVDGRARGRSSGTGASVLEIGSGARRPARRRSSRRAGVGVDVSPGMVELARVAASGAAVRGRGRRGARARRDLRLRRPLRPRPLRRRPARALPERRRALAPRHADRDQLLQPALAPDRCAVLELLRLKQRTPIRNWLTIGDVQNLLQLAGLEPVTTTRRILFPLRDPVPLGVPERRPRAAADHPPPLPDLLDRGARQQPPAERRGAERLRRRAGEERGRDDRADRRGDTARSGSRSELIFVEGHSTRRHARRDPAADRAAPRARDRLRPADRQGQGRRGAARVRARAVRRADDPRRRPDRAAARSCRAFLEAIATGRAEFVNGSRLVYGLEPRRDALPQPARQQGVLARLQRAARAAGEGHALRHQGAEAARATSRSPPAARTSATSTRSATSTSCSARRGST